MTLIDAGPLIALVDRNEPRHTECVEVLKTLSAPLVTTCAAFTEATYLLGKTTGWQGQERLMRLVLRGDLAVASLESESCTRVAALMQKYRDQPMDLADATLVALAEKREVQRIFTLDRHFYAYRLHDRTAFEVVP
jgi:predicted nucleic acid-binding protein